MIEVALYQQEGIAREGIREQLILNPVIFGSHSEIIADLRSKIPKWKLVSNASQSLAAEWKHKLLPGYTGKRHEYDLTVQVHNPGTKMVDTWRIEVKFPAQFIDGPQGPGKPGQFIIYKMDDSTVPPVKKRLWPNSVLEVFKIRYFVTDNNWPGDPGEYDPHSAFQSVQITVSTVEGTPWIESIPMYKIENF